MVISRVFRSLDIPLPPPITTYLTEKGTKVKEKKEKGKATESRKQVNVRKRKRKAELAKASVGAKNVYRKKKS